MRHVAMFRWNDQATEERRRTVADRLAELPGIIPEVRSYSFGTNAGINPGGFDFVVVADFADRDGYIVYRDHPAHRTVVSEVITPIVAERASIQYEI